MCARKFFEIMYLYRGNREVTGWMTLWFYFLVLEICRNTPEWDNVYVRSKQRLSVPKKYQSYATNIYFYFIFFHAVCMLYFCEMAHKGSTLFRNINSFFVVVVFGRSSKNPEMRDSQRFLQWNIIYNFYSLLLSIIFLPNDLPIQPLAFIRPRCFYCVQYFYYCSYNPYPRPTHRLAALTL